MRPLVLLAAALGVMSVALVRAQAPAPRWEQIDDADGIRVWKSDVPGIDLPGFRGETTMDASVETIVAALKDWRQHTKWMNRCVESRELKHLSDDESLMYNRTASPWPVWDRDVILTTRTEREPDGKTVWLRFQNAKSDARPVPEKVVRMPRLTGFYRLVRLGAAKTVVTYQVEADPGGSLPRWVAVRVARELPAKTLAALRKRVTGKDG